MKTLLLLFFFTVLITSCVPGLHAEIVKILIQGDTQKIMNSYNGEQDNFVPFMAKVLTDPVTRDADFILQMGDIVESDKDNSDRPQQYAVAREGWRQLDGKIPYVLNLGNNDAADEYFAAFSDLDLPLYSNNNGKNFAYVFNAGNIDWLVISLRFGSVTAEIEWMEDLVIAHPDKKVILIKHEVNVDGGVVGRLKKHPNVVLVLSGHTRSQEELLVGDRGNKIGWIRTCHHNAYLDSYFRVLLINTVRGTVSSSFYSPQYEKFWHDPTAPYHDCDRSAPWTFEGFDFGAEKLSSAPEENNAEFISLENIPCCILADEDFQAIAVVENTGTIEWDADLQQNKYKLGSENPKGNQTWGSATFRTLVSEDVMPGERHRFEINCTAPSQEGLYNFQLRMLQERVQWFGEFSKNRVVYVAPNKVVSGSSGDVVINSRVPEESHFAYRGVEYSDEVDTIDLDHDSLECGYYSKPGWLNFDSEKGILSGTPRNKDIGIHAVTLFAKDAENEKIFAFNIRVMEAPPIVQWNEIHEIVGGMKEDRDKDGLVDFLEFALGGNPNKNDAANKLPKLLLNDSGLDFTFRRNQSTLMYTVKESADLIDWSDYTVVDNSHGFVGDTCIVPLPVSDKKRFFRLEVSQ